MNRQPNPDSQTVHSLKHSASYQSQKEKAMNRRIATVLFVLFAALVLSACAAQSPLQTPGSVTLLPKVAGPVVSGPQVNDRQQLADYQAKLNSPAITSTAAKSGKTSGVQIRDRQQLAEYQATLPLSFDKARPAVTVVQQISDRQALADYQASLR